MGCFSKLKRNKQKIIARLEIVGHIFIIIGLSSLTIMHLVLPQIAFFTLPSLMSLVAGYIKKYAPDKLEDAKKLFLEYIDKEEDTNEINKAFEEVSNKLSSRSARSHTIIELSQPPINFKNNTPKTPTEPIHTDLKIRLGEIHFDKQGNIQKVICDETPRV